MYNSITNLHTVCELRCDSSASKYFKHICVYVTFNNLLIIWNCAKELKFMAWHAEKSFFKPKITPSSTWESSLFEMNNYAVRCSLVHFEKCYSVYTDLVASWWFFQYSYLSTVIITIFFRGKLGIFGGSFYPSNTLDGTLVLNRTTSWRFSQFLL